MRATARLRYMKGSAQKVRLVADTIRGKKAEVGAKLGGPPTAPGAAPAAGGAAPAAPAGKGAPA